MLRERVSQEAVSSDGWAASVFLRSQDFKKRYSLRLAVGVGSIVLHRLCRWDERTGSCAGAKQW